jgi:serine/threonine protein kinase
VKHQPPNQALSLPPSRRVELRLGTYRPCLEIGSGGMATVYIAREAGETGLQRTVALKVMHEHLSHTERYKKRFLDEARILSRLAHPYVCRVLGYGEDKGRPFMAMEYLVGEPLSRVLRALRRRTDVTAAERARIFARVIANIAEGIHAAHETRDAQGRLLGVIHRDVSPQNLFMLYDGTVRILDFGIAWYRDRYVQTATTSRLIGKLPYMAPEQIQGTVYDRRVDIWALGVVLWEMVTLERLFRRETEVRTMEAVCSEPLVPLSEVVGGIPPGFDAILARALERDPARRFQTAREFAQSLDLWLTRTGQATSNADLSHTLSELFPGSEEERRRWAEAPAAEALNVKKVPQDFNAEARDSVELSELSLSLPMRMVREEDLVSTEYTPPPEFKRFSREPTRDIQAERALLFATSEVERDVEPMSAAPETNASPVAMSVREPLPKQEAEVPRGWIWGGAICAIALTLGLMMGNFFQTPRHVAGAAATPISVGQIPGGQGSPDLTQAALAGGGTVIATPFADGESPADPGARLNQKQEQQLARADENAINLDDDDEVSGANPGNPSRGNQVDATPPQAVAQVAGGTAAVDDRGSATPVARAASDGLNIPSASQTGDSSKAAASRGTSLPVSKVGTSGATVGKTDYVADDMVIPTDGDVLVTSPTPGRKVYLGNRLLGQTPMRARLPAGPVTLSVEGPGERRAPLTTYVTPGRVNIVSLQ